jgi:hypothetical protein
MVAELRPLTSDVLRREYADMPQVQAALAAGNIELAQTIVVLRHFQALHRSALTDAKHARVTSEQVVANNKTLAVSADRMVLMAAREASLAAEKVGLESSLNDIEDIIRLQAIKTSELAAINETLRAEAKRLQLSSDFKSLAAGLQYVHDQGLIDPNLVSLPVSVDQGVSIY